MIPTCSVLEHGKADPRVRRGDGQLTELAERNVGQYRKRELRDVLVRNVSLETVAFPVSRRLYLLAQGGLDLGIVSDEFYAVILASAIITMLLTPIFLTLVSRFGVPSIP